jgi:hypothetical protein
MLQFTSRFGDVRDVQSANFEVLSLSAVSQVTLSSEVAREWKLTSTSPLVLYR